MAPEVIIVILLWLIGRAGNPVQAIKT